MCPARLLRVTTGPNRHRGSAATLRRRQAVAGYSAPLPRAPPRVVVSRPRLEPQIDVAFRDDAAGERLGHGHLRGRLGRRRRRRVVKSAKPAPGTPQHASSLHGPSTRRGRAAADEPHEPRRLRHAEHLGRRRAAVALEPARRRRLVAREGAVDVAPRHGAVGRDAADGLEACRGAEQLARPRARVNQRARARVGGPSERLLTRGVETCDLPISSTRARGAVVLLEEVAISNLISQRVKMQLQL